MNGHKHIVITALLGFILSGLVFGLTGCQKGPRTFTVRPGESIQAAIDAAPQGSVIQLTYGEFYECVEIGKSMTLRGHEEGTTIHRCWDEELRSVIEVYPPEYGEIVVALDSLAIIGAEERPGSGISVVAFSGNAEITITGCTVSHHSAFGIDLWYSTQATITNCSLTANGYSVVLIGPAQAGIGNCLIADSYYGVWLQESSQATVRDSVFERNVEYGIVVQSAQTTITNSTFRKHGHLLGGRAIAVSGNSKAFIQDSVIAENTIGVDLTGNSETHLTGCSLVQNQRPLDIRQEARTTLTNNTVSDNGNPVWISDNAHVVLTNNRIVQQKTGWGYGVMLHGAPCYDYQDAKPFRGIVEGGGNIIEENRRGEVCPDALMFLMTEEGGELNRRE